MATAIPTDVETLIENIRIEQFWWDGVQIKIPFHCVYACIPNPVADEWKLINGAKVPLIRVDKYLIPLWDPFHQNMSEMPKMAVVISHHKGNQFGLFAYPADHIDEHIMLSYDEWFETQSSFQ
jgi:hypothetical protein